MPARVVFTAISLLTAYGGGAAQAAASYCPIGSTHGAQAAQASLGRALFSEPRLSASGRQSCASCHDPRYAYGPAPGSAPVAQGGVQLDQPGLRAVPSLRYAQEAPLFEWHFHVTRGDEREDVGPGGGLMSDGRAATLDEQALLPLLDAREMANRDIHELAGRLRALPVVQQWLAGAPVRPEAAALRDDARLAACAAQALAEFQRSDASFHPFDSRYDDYLRGRGSLSAQELRGLALFTDARKGNCAECHTATSGPGGSLPLFTDHRFAALGVPRNPRIPANADPAFYDLGACGPLRNDAGGDESVCGFFRTPTLRNAARRPYYFHNARFSSLREALQFYVTRDLQPRRWYGVAGRYDDLPSAQQLNVDRSDAPFDRRPGEAPALGEAEIDDLLAFLKTLDDRS